MISALFVSTLLGAGPVPALGESLQSVRRAFIEDGADRVSVTSTHHVRSLADGSLVLQGSQPLRLSLQTIRRERGAACRAALLSREIDPADPHTVRALRDCEVEETWTNGSEGLAQAFTVQRAPRGRGGLTLRVQVDGPWHHQDELGHVFKGPGASEQLRYGKAFVVRDGQRHPIPVVHVEGGLELRVPAALVDAPNAFPMVIDPVLSGEVPLDRNLFTSPTPTDDEGPAIAVNAAGVAMVVWTDTRRGLGFDVFGARINSTGVMDPAGLPLATFGGQQLRPAICADGRGYVLAYDVPLADAGFEVRARPISESGVAGNEFVVGPGTQVALASTPDAGTVMVAMIDPSANLTVFSLTGMTRGASVGTIPANNRAAHPAIAAGPRGWFVAWENTSFPEPNATIRGMDNTGNVTLLSSNDVSTTAVSRPSVALSTQNTAQDAFIFWEQAGSLARGVRYSSSNGTTPINNVPGVRPWLVRTSTADGVLPTVGTIVATGTTQVQLTDLTDNSTSSFQIGARPNDLVLAYGGKLYAAWTQTPLGFSSDVHGALVSAVTAATPTVLLSGSANTQRNPRIAMTENQDEGLSVWIEDGKRVLGAKIVVGITGLQVNAPFELRAPGLMKIDQVDVAAEGPDDNYLVVWRQGPNILGSFTNNLGAAQPSFVIGSGAYAGPAVAFDQGSGNFVVVWAQDMVTNPKVSSVTVSPGVVSSERVHGTEAAQKVAVTCMRARCLVAWEASMNTVRGSVHTGFANLSLFSWPQATSPAVANDGVDFFMGWLTDDALAFARVDFMTGNAALITISSTTPNGMRYTSLSMASAVPPVVAWSELTTFDESTVYLNRLGFLAQSTRVSGGSVPSVAVTSSGATEPVGVAVYQRFEGAGLRGYRSFGTIFSYAPDASFIDAGLDAGFDAGFDAGTDAGTDGGRDGGVDVQPDAGVDAGTDAGMEQGDGGVVMFGTAGCTCSSGSVTPLIFFALLALRRRRAPSPCEAGRGLG